jgi:hypothetical protein
VNYSLLVDVRRQKKGINISPSAVVKEAGGVSGEIIRSARELVLIDQQDPTNC